MKVLCPRCSTHVPTANISLETGWTKCAACEEIFPLSDVVSGFPAGGASAPPRPDRPFNARALAERTGEALLVYVPPEGMRAATWGLLGFTTFWLGFVAFWTAGALGLFFGANPGVIDWLFASFSIPFWLVGFGMLAAVVWKARGTKSIRIDADGMRTHLRCLVLSRTRWVERDHIQHARHYVPQVKSSDGTEQYGAEIVYRSGSFVLPADSEDEVEWLVAEINDFVKSLRA